MSAKAKYPEHEKLEKVKAESQRIGEFLEATPYTLCEWHDGALNGGEGDSGFMPVRGSINDLLAKHFGIDLEVLEAEKRQMLDELQAAA